MVLCKNTFHGNAATNYNVENNQTTTNASQNYRTLFVNHELKLRLYLSTVKIYSRFFTENYMSALQKCKTVDSFITHSQRNGMFTKFLHTKLSLPFL